MFFFYLLKNSIQKPIFKNPSRHTPTGATKIYAPVGKTNEKTPKKGDAKYRV
jgi:hypothetical protein